MMRINGLTYKENLIMKLIQNNPGKEVSELLELSDQLKSKTGLYRMLKRLEKQGKVTKQVQYKPVVYEHLIKYHTYTAEEKTIV